MQYRFIEESDFEDLALLEEELFPGKPDSFYRCQPAALRFFARSSHTFVADENGLQGFVLAQAVWQGDRATVLITRIAAKSNEAYSGLLKAVLKSAYDANAYEIVLFINKNTRNNLYNAALDVGFSNSGLEMISRVLGSRGQRGEITGIFE